MLVCVRDELVCQLSQAAFAIAPARGFIRPRADERADAAPRFDDAAAFQFVVNLRDRIGVDSQINRELPDGR